MIVTMAKALAYTKAPKTTFSTLHPVRAARLKKMDWDLRHAYAPRVAAVGAALIALPLGYMIGRMANGTVESVDE